VGLVERLADLNVLAVRAQRSGGFLKEAKQRIHVEVE